MSPKCFVQINNCGWIALLYQLHSHRTYLPPLFEQRVPRKNMNNLGSIDWAGLINVTEPLYYVITPISPKRLLICPGKFLWPYTGSQLTRENYDWLLCHSQDVHVISPAVGGLLSFGSPRQGPQSSGHAGLTPVTPKTIVSLYNVSLSTPLLHLNFFWMDFFSWTLNLCSDPFLFCRYM